MTKLGLREFETFVCRIGTGIPEVFICLFVFSTYFVHAILALPPVKYRVTGKGIKFEGF